MPNDQERLSSGPTDIIVNTTPLGTKGHQEEATIATARQLEGTKLVYDLVYNPAETRLMKEAKKAGVKAINGLEMIIRQGTRQFEIWTGQKAPIHEMRAAVVKQFFP
jgi:shikimate 5-dehydrogenase